MIKTIELILPDLDPDVYIVSDRYQLANRKLRIFGSDANFIISYLIDALQYNGFAYLTYMEAATNVSS